MADVLGITQIPIVAPSLATDVVGDLTLQRLGQFLKAAINRNGNTAWRTRRGGATANVVEHVFYHDPKRLFDESRLPALYLWRSSTERRRESDDVLKVTSRITIYWVEEPAQPEVTIRRAPFAHVVDKIMALVLHRERDPSWIVSGDTDPLSATRGSFLPDQLGYNWMLKSGGSGLEMSAHVTDGDGDRDITFTGLATGVDIEELATWDTELYTYAAALDAEISQGGRHAGDIYEPDDDGAIQYDNELLRHDGAAVVMDG